MKKVLFAIAICFITMAALSSCSSHDNTPEGVAKAAVECLKAKDYKGYMDLTSATKEQKEAMTAMLQKVGQQTDEKGGVKSYEIVDQEIDEEKGTATVNVKVTYGNGDTEENKMKMLKKDGEWVLSADK